MHAQEKCTLIAFGAHIVKLRIPRFAPFLGCVIWLAGCSQHTGVELGQIGVAGPDRYKHAADAPSGRAAVELRWWEVFGDQQLDIAVETALQANLDLRVAWSRLAQATALARMQGAERFPQLEVTASATRTRAEGVGAQEHASDTKSYLLSTGPLGLSYELDLWRRVANTKEAADLSRDASRQDVETTALLVAASVTDTWFAVQEQQALLELFDEQLQVSRELLSVTETRFVTGAGSALDVLQQRQQLESLGSEIPRVHAKLELLRNELAILLGESPSQAQLIVGKEIFEPKGELPELPALPELVRPLDLLEARPDLRAERLRLLSADREVAVAIAERLPRLRISLNYSFEAAVLGGLFDKEVRSLVGELVGPIIDGGRRRAKVDQRRAIAQERIHALGHAYLRALGEVEDALVREKYQLDLLGMLERQLELGEQSLRQSRSRHINGLTDYLSVLVAVQKLQELERRFIQEKRSLLAFRTELYRAMGGAWTEGLVPPVSNGPHGETSRPAYASR